MKTITKKEINTIQNKHIDFIKDVIGGRNNLSANNKIDVINSITNNKMFLRENKKYTIVYKKTVNRFGKEEVYIKDTKFIKETDYFYFFKNFRISKDNLICAFFK